MLKIQNKNGDNVIKITESGIEIMSEELYLNGTKLEEDTDKKDVSTDQSAGSEGSTQTNKDSKEG